MTSSRVPFPSTLYDQESPKTVVYKFQIRMEIAVDEKAARVNVGSLFHNLVRRAHGNDNTTIFLDVDEKEVTHNDTFSATNFGDRFKVEQVSLGKMKKVAMGFFVRTNLTFANLKVAIGHQWLRDNKVYLREQALPFGFGTDLSLIGFYTMEHPWFGDVQLVLNAIEKAWSEAMTTEINDDDKKRLRQLENERVITGSAVNIPFTVERSKTLVKSPDPSKPAFACDV